jgi:hypothetical protein
MYIDDVDFDVPHDQLTLDQLETKYAHVMRHASDEYRRMVETCGPLDEADPTLRQRQELYRCLEARRSGVVLPTKSGDIARHPV